MARIYTGIRNYQGETLPIVRDRAIVDSGDVLLLRQIGLPTCANSGCNLGYNDV